MLKLLAQHLAWIFDADNDTKDTAEMDFGSNKSMYLIGFWR